MVTVALYSVTTVLRKCCREALKQKCCFPGVLCDGGDSCQFRV